MAEKIISPGVFTNEIDQSFLPSAVADIGAALIGPTVKGPAGIPTIVTSYSEFQQKFGDAFTSGSNSYQYLTSHTAEQYLKNSNTLTVVRVMDGTFSPATANVGSGLTAATSTFTVADGDLNTADQFTEGEFVKMIAADGTVGIFILANGAVTNDVATGDVLTATSDLGAGTPSAALLAQGTCIAVENNLSTHAQHTVLSEIATAVVHSNSPLNGKITAASISGTGDGAQTLVFTQATAGGNGNTTTTTNISQLTTGNFTGGGNSFKLNTVADGAIMNNAGPIGNNSLLESGSRHNIRWEVSSVNNNKGTFSLLVRRGDDTIKRKQTVETWNNLSLDPNTNNYIGKRIGDSYQTIAGTESDPYLTFSGKYPLKSKYVYVSEVTDTLDYLDENGKVRLPAASASLPIVGSGSVGGTFKQGSNGYAGTATNPSGISGSARSLTYQMYDKIDNSDTQGFSMDANQGLTGYNKAINLLSNQDEYDINMILVPGLLQSAAKHSPVISKVIDTCEDRGDAFTIIDPVGYGSAITDATGEAGDYDSNYAAMYWPWIQVPDNQTGTSRWVPPSVALGGIYAFNDKVAHPWFAPAGLNRGGIDIAIQAERKLTHGNRDDLYDAHINPIATFPGQGVTVWGQKTLQKKASALDRVNVRRLLIKVKKFIASSSRFLVFEQNNSSTRRRFLNIVNPFLEQVQSNSGLTAFKVVMDETNNTPDVVDRNTLYGQIFVQPTRTAEFIVLDFTVQPTGATFPE